MPRIESKPKELEVKMVLTRAHGGPDEYFRLEISDGSSGLMIAYIKIPTKEMADFISARRIDATAELFHDERYGKTHECKTVLIQIPHPTSADQAAYGEYDAKLNLIYAAAEVDNPGWEADRGKWNHHRSKNGKYEVILRRYV